MAAGDNDPPLEPVAAGTIEEAVQNCNVDLDFVFDDGHSFVFDQVTDPEVSLLRMSDWAWCVTKALEFPEWFWQFVSDPDGALGTTQFTFGKYGTIVTRQGENGALLVIYDDTVAPDNATSPAAD